jgi:hypothetical protein
MGTYKDHSIMYDGMIIAFNEAIGGAMDYEEVVDMYDGWQQST